MSSATHSTAQFDVPLRMTGRALNQAASALVALFDDAIELRPGPEGALVAVCAAIKLALGLEVDGCVDVEHQNRMIKINASGEGRRNLLFEVAEILAAHGITGEICFEDADFVNMRFRLADGVIYVGRGHLVYVEAPVGVESATG